MKKREEMIMDVHRRIDEYESEKKMKRARITKVAAAVTPVCAAAVVGAGLWRAGAFSGVSDKPVVSTAETTVSVTQQMTAEVTTSGSVENVTSGKTELYYSELVGNKKMPELEGYSGAAESSFADISEFDDDMLKEYAAGVVEGEIVDIWVNHYEYQETSNKFEPNGRLYHKDSTVAYKIKVNRVLSGSFQVGEEVTVEDRFFPLDSVVSIKKGGTYVVPIAKGEGKLFTTNEVVGGNNVLESSYYTFYQFETQIEKVSGGYVVTESWKTLITDECTEVTMDIEDADSIFHKKMYFVPESVFNERFELLLKG